jgi:zinc protease
MLPLKLPAQSFTPTPAPAQATNVKEIKQWFTENGMKVLFQPEHSLPMVDFRLVFNAGGARDTVNNVRRSGLANLTNRLIFEGTDRMNADQVAEAFANIGVDYGNGIDRDMAKISLRSLTEQGLLDTAITTLSTILEYTNFPPQAIERERNRILVELEHEIQLPVKRASLMFYRAVYGSHPYASPLSGNRKSVKKITRQQIVAFHRQYYVAQNAVLAMVGDLSEQKARSFSERLSRALPGGRKAPQLPKVITMNSPRLISKKHNSVQTTVFMGQTAVRRGEPDYFPFYVGNYILGSFGARLMKEIRLKRGLTYTIESLLIPMQEMGPFLIRFSAQPAVVKEIIDLIIRNVNIYLTWGPTQMELKQAKTFIISYFPFRIDSNQDRVENLADIGFYNLPLTYLDDYVANIRAVTRKQIMEVFRRRIDPGKMLTVIMGPQTKDGVYYYKKKPASFTLPGF